MDVGRAVTSTDPNTVSLLCSLFIIQPPKKDGSLAAEKKAQQVKELLEKIEALISSRDDLTDTAENGELTSIYPTLPTGSDLDDSLQHVLNETSFLQYRGAVMDDLCKKSLFFLLQAQVLPLAPT
jgi:hypothetical protein